MARLSHGSAHLDTRVSGGASAATGAVSRSRPWRYRPPFPVSTQCGSNRHFREMYRFGHSQVADRVLACDAGGPTLLSGLQRPPAAVFHLLSVDQVRMTGR